MNRIGITRLKSMIQENLSILVILHRDAHDHSNSNRCTRYDVIDNNEPSDLRNTGPVLVQFDHDNSRKYLHRDANCLGKTESLPIR